MQNSKITMKELLYKMACYQELYPNVHLFEKTDLNQMNSNFLSNTIEAFRLKKDCTKLEYCKDKVNIPIFSFLFTMKGISLQ